MKLSKVWRNWFQKGPWVCICSTLSCDKIEDMHTHGLNCIIKQCHNCPKFDKLLCYAPLETEWLLFRDFKKFQFFSKRCNKFGQIGKQRLENSFSKLSLLKMWTEISLSWLERSARPILPDADCKLCNPLVIISSSCPNFKTAFIHISGAEPLVKNFKNTDC